MRHKCDTTENISLTGISDTKVVVFETDFAIIRVDLNKFKGYLDEVPDADVKELLGYLKQETQSSEVSLNKLIERYGLSNKNAGYVQGVAEFKIAKLLEQGQADVYDKKNKENFKMIKLEYWCVHIEPCGGGRGREFKTIDGTSILKVTDIIE